MRKRSHILDLLCCGIIATSVTATAWADTPAEFGKANQEYAAGHFKEAADAYEQAVRSGSWSANLFYDLGNAYFHSGNFGRAILNYERALALDRHHPEAQANLRIARDEARALELAPSRTERFAQLGSVNQYVIASAIAFWIGVFCIAAFLFSRRRSSGVMAMSILSLFIFVFAILSAYWIENGNKGRQFAVITSDNVEARLATADSARTVLALPAGSEIKILSDRGDWIYAALPNDLRGWIPAKSAESVRL
jgi:tetratricopeptide (TPR) repeat protein